MAGKPWTTAERADFALKVREVILDYRGGYISAEEAVTKISYEYREHIGELE